MLLKGKFNFQFDINAAINIRNIGLNTLGTSGIYACGVASGGDIAYDISSYAMMKQENLGVGLEAPNALALG
jgi:hypothetical protein